MVQVAPFGSWNSPISAERVLQGATRVEACRVSGAGRYHRRSRPSLKHREFAALGEADQHRVQWCAAVLRIAIGLDRSHAGAVGSLRVKISATSITIVVEPSQADPDSISLELYSAEERSGLLASLAEREVVFELAAKSVVAR